MIKIKVWRRGVYGNHNGRCLNDWMNKNFGHNHNNNEDSDNGNDFGLYLNVLIKEDIDPFCRHVNGYGNRNDKDNNNNDNKNV